MAAKYSLEGLSPDTVDAHRRAWIKEYRKDLADGRYRINHFIQQKFINLLRKQFGTGLIVEALLIILLTAIIGASPLWIDYLNGGAPILSTITIGSVAVLVAIQLLILFLSNRIWSLRSKERRITLATELSVSTLKLFKKLQAHGFFHQTQLDSCLSDETRTELIEIILKNIKRHFTLVNDKVGDVSEFSVTLFVYDNIDPTSMCILANTHGFTRADTQPRRKILAHFVAESGKDFALMDAWKLPPPLFSNKTFDQQKRIVNRSKYLIPLNFRKPGDGNAFSDGDEDKAGNNICKGVISISFPYPNEFFMTHGDDHKVIRHHIFFLKKLIESRNHGVEIRDEP